MDPISITLLCLFGTGISLGSGAIGAACTRGEDRQAQRNERRVTMLERRLVAAGVPTGGNEQITLTAEELADPIRFMINMLNESPAEVQLRTRVCSSIDMVLRQARPSQAELSKCLIWTARLGADDRFVSFMQKLLDKGANPNCTDDNGDRPLSIAIDFCAPKAVAVLIAQNNIDLTTPIRGKTITTLANERIDTLDEATVVQSNTFGPNSLTALKAYQLLSLRVRDQIQEKLVV